MITYEWTCCGLGALVVISFSLKNKLESPTFNVGCHHFALMSYRVGWLEDRITMCQLSFFSIFIPLSFVTAAGHSCYLHPQ
jgi:hypothetical protein